MRRAWLVVAAIAGLVACGDAQAGPLIFAAAGSAIGYGMFSAGMLWAGATAASALQLGWMAGSILGSLVMGNGQDVRQEGPRLSDTKLQNASYGTPIGYGFGVIKKAGGAIWGQDVEEHVHTETHDQGKGGGSVTTTTYSYTVSFAVAMHDGPVVAFRRIWKDGDLVYDRSSDATIEALIASNKVAEKIRFYTGSETQLPDPLIEAVQGAGLVPAYRGTAYIVFEDLPTTQNRVPMIEAEMVVSGGTEVYTKDDDSVTYTNPPQIDLGSNAGTWTMSCANLIDSVRSVHNGRIENGVMELFSFDTPGGVDGGTFYKHTYGLNGLKIENEPFWETPANFSELYEAGMIQVAHTNYSDERAFCVWRPAGVHPRQVAYVNLDQRSWRVIGDLSDFTANLGRGVTSFTQKNGHAYMTSLLDGSPRKVKVWSYTPFASSCAELYSQDEASPLASGTFSICVAGDRYVFVLIAWQGGGLFKNDVYRFPHGEPAFDREWHLSSADANAVIDPGGFLFGLHIADEDANVLIAPKHGGVCEFRDGVVSHVTATGFPIWVTGGSVTGSLMMGADVIAIVDPDGEAVEWWGRHCELGSPPTVGSMIQSIGTKASGLTAADWNVAAATITCDGYIVSARMPADAAIQPLLTAYFIDIVESNGKLKCVVRGGAPVATLALDDLGARDPADDPGPPVIETRASAVDLPDVVDVLYISADADHAEGHQQESRRSGSMKLQQTVTLPIRMTDAKARHVAEAICYAAEIALQKYQFNLDKRWAELEVGDPINLPVNGELVYVVPRKIDLGANDVYMVWAERDDPTLYTGSPIAQPIPIGASSLALAGVTRAVLFDSNILRDVDDYLGIHLAARGYTTGWPGMALYRSLDGGGTYDGVENGLLETPTVMGMATTALGAAPARSEHIDFAGSVDVLLFSGDSLSSVARDQLFNGANAFALVAANGQAEVFQALTVTALGGRVWRLTNLLRAQRGTPGPAHAAGEAFVVLDPQKMRRVRVGLSDLNVARTYKAVTLGASVQETDPRSFTVAGGGLKPLPLLHLAGGRNAAGDWILKGVPQTRLDAPLVDLTEGPVGETPEAYEVDILQGAVVKRTLAVGSPLATYTIAQQNADFGSGQSSLSVNWYQMSAAVGRGFVASATF